MRPRERRQDGRLGAYRRRRDYHFDDTTLFITIETPAEGTGGVPADDSLADG